MELSLGGLIGAVIGAALGVVNFAIIAPMVNEKLRAADTQARQEPGRPDIEDRISTARRSILAFNMLVFVCAGYWAGTTLG